VVVVEAVAEPQEAAVAVAAAAVRLKALSMP